MPQSDQTSLWHTLVSAGNLQDRFVSGASATVRLGELLEGTSLRECAGELCGRSVIIAPADQLTAALTLVELDGVARRLILCPPDLPAEHFSFVIETVPADAIVSDHPITGNYPSVGPRVICSPQIAAAVPDRRLRFQTEWILLTSGTTGAPKMVSHTLASLTGAIGYSGAAQNPLVWSTFYDIRRYGGLQIFLRAMLTGASLVVSNAAEPAADFLRRAGRHGVTHISGTPSHWRRALLTPAARSLDPQYVRLSGEIVDQSILDGLHAYYPNAKVAHAFASTEAGVAFDVRDGLAGFPASLIEHGSGDVEMKVEDGSLRIRSTRTASRYLGPAAAALAGADGFIDTGDMVELRGDRYYFVGRRDGVINVGGLKVHPEEVEAVINRHADVRMCLVRARRNPVLGAVVVAEVVPSEARSAAKAWKAELEAEIRSLCLETLPRHKVPASIRFVAALDVAPTGKIRRQP